MSVSRPRDLRLIERAVLLMGTKLLQSIKFHSPTADYDDLSDEELPEPENRAAAAVSQDHTSSQQPSDTPMKEDIDDVHVVDDVDDDDVSSWIFVTVNYDPYNFRPVPINYFYTPTATFYEKNLKKLATKDVSKVL
eukprot:sb/3474580/